MRFKLMALALLLLAGGGSAQEPQPGTQAAGQPAATEQAADPEPADQDDSAAEEDAATAEELEDESDATEPTRPNQNLFRPSEEITADSAISFPADI